MIADIIDYDSYYGILELQPGASLRAIKQNYRKLARRWHPDKASDSEKPAATEKMQALNEAHAVLTAYWETNGCAPLSAEQQHQEALRRQQQAEAQSAYEEQERERCQEEQRQREEAVRKAHEEQLRREQEQREEDERRALAEEQRRREAAAVLSPGERKALVAIVIAAVGAFCGLAFAISTLLNNFWLYLNALHGYTFIDLLFNLAALALWIALLLGSVVGGIAGVIQLLIFACPLIADAIRGSARTPTTVKIVTFFR